MKAFMYMIGYDQGFQKMFNTGWGCGYVAIPKDYKSFTKHWEQQNQESSEDMYRFGLPYFEVIRFDQEITFTELKTFGDEEYLVIGFDTDHRWNDEKHNHSYVLTETFKMLQAIEEYENLTQ